MIQAMMMGGGFMLDMMVKVRQNLAMLPSKQPKFKEGRRPKYTYVKSDKELRFKNVSKKELEEIVSRIRTDARKENKKWIWMLAISVLSLIVILFLFDFAYRWLFSG